MRVAEVRIDAGLGKRVLINCAHVGKNSRRAVRIVRGTKLRIYRARRAAGDTVAALGPGPSHGVAYRDVDCIRHKHIATLSHCYIENLAVPMARRSRPAVRFDLQYGSRCERHFSVASWLRCLLPDSACDKNIIANIVASEKVSRNTAFNRFMILFVFSVRQHLRIFFS